MQQLNGTVAGYEPGGNGSHGLALALIRDSKSAEISMSIHEHADDVFSALVNINEFVASALDNTASSGSIRLEES